MKTYLASWHSIKCFDNNYALFSVWGVLKPTCDIVKGLTNINCDSFLAICSWSCMCLLLYQNTKRKLSLVISNLVQHGQLILKKLKQMKIKGAHHK